MNGPTGPTATIDKDAARKQLVAALARIAGGDRGGLRLLYRDTSAKLFAVCVRILRDEGEAEDVLQDVYTTVWQRAGTFDPARASPITWLVAIARNRSIDRLRAGAMGARTRTIDDAADVSDNASNALAQIESLQEERRLTDCLGELEPRHAVAVRFAFLDGMTYDELARRMNVPLGTMKSWIRRSLLRLRECLER
ncbi:MAG: sigma-70 family RNA polymerase sigma factor [Xanthobacteraceae bacterium]